VKGLYAGYGAEMQNAMVERDRSMQDDFDVLDRTQQARILEKFGSVEAWYKRRKALKYAIRETRAKIEYQEKRIEHLEILAARIENLCGDDEFWKEFDTQAMVLVGVNEWLSGVEGCKEETRNSEDE